MEKNSIIKDRKGYVLSEIILASAIAFGIIYFMMTLTIKLKNKNDDLIVETQVATDNAIISNKLMEKAKSERNKFNCNKLTITNNNTVIYDGQVIDVINQYGKLGIRTCTNVYGIIRITIPVTVKQMPNRDFTIRLYYMYDDNMTTGS